MNGLPDDRTSIRWRITAMLSPEIVALILIVILALAIIVGLRTGVLPWPPASGG